MLVAHNQMNRDLRTIKGTVAAILVPYAVAARSKIGRVRNARTYSAPTALLGDRRVRRQM